MDRLSDLWIGVIAGTLRKLNGSSNLPDEVAGRIGFDDVSARARGLRLAFVLIVVERRSHHDAGSIRMISVHYPPRGLDAIHVFQVDIHEDHVRAFSQHLV